MASDAGFLRGCCLNYIFKDTVSNIFSKQILTIILVSGRSHILSFAFCNIKGINFLVSLTLKLCQFKKLCMGVMTNRIQFACFGNLYHIQWVLWQSNKWMKLNTRWPAICIKHVLYLSEELNSLLEKGKL